ncbi:vacuolar aminopeptidase 1 [Lecanora helva]
MTRRSQKEIPTSKDPQLVERMSQSSISSPSFGRVETNICKKSGSTDVPVPFHGCHDCFECRVKNSKIREHAKSFLHFITSNPTVFHAVDSVANRLKSNGFVQLFERDSWTDKLSRGGKYFFDRNGSSVIAFAVGDKYVPGNGASVIASHIDALTTRVKPISTLSTKAGYVQLGVAPYAGALNSTWWDRDLGIGGRVLVRDGKTGKIEKKLVKLGWPIARIPTLAPHFGAAADLSNPNKETQMVPIIGLDSSNSDEDSANEHENAGVLGGAGTFTATQPPRLVKAIASEMNIQDYSTIVNWELELFDTQPAQLGGLEHEFIFAGRVDDKLCSYAAIEALIASCCESSESESDSSIIKLVGCFDDEEIGSLLRQGAHSNLLPSTLERICETFAEGRCGANVVSQMYANSFLISADVSHAVNPNFLGAYLENHSPRLNTGVAIQADPNGHTTTDSVSTAFLQCVADKCNAKLQVFQIRNDSRSGGTVGPMLSSAMGMRAIDAGLPQLSMHSIRATIGSLDPGLGVQLFKGFFDHFEEVDAEFR